MKNECVHLLVNAIDWKVYRIRARFQTFNYRMVNLLGYYEEPS